MHQLEDAKMWLFLVLMCSLTRARNQLRSAARPELDHPALVGAWIWLDWCASHQIPGLFSNPPVACNHARKHDGNRLDGASAPCRRRGSSEQAATST
jgi:hypothetical protein